MGNALKTKDYLNALKIYQINELNDQNNIFISIDLMYMKVNNEIKFIDINKNIINVDINSFLNVNPNYFGNNHLYAFQNVLYTKNKIQITSKSSINEINEDYLFNKDEYKLINNLSNINDNTILNFYSKISSFSFINNSIQTKEGVNVKLELNNHLIKKISTNGITYFRNFIKQGNQILSTKLSYINTFEETFIQFFFYDYKIKDNIYDRLIVENNDIIIDNDIIKYKIKKKIKSRYYVDKIILKGNKKELTFYLYLYKGQINNVVCFINIEGGYFYEYIYQSLDSKNLPDSQNISNQAIYQYDSFQNKYKRRFNILNIKKQVINREEIIFTNDDEDKDIKVNTYYNDFNQWNSWQIFIIIKDREYVFSETKIKMISEKKKINFEDTFEKELDKFYSEYKKKALVSEEKEVFEKKYSLLFQDKYIIKENSEEDSDENKKKDKKFDLIEDFVQNKSTESIDDNENNNEDNSYNYQKYLSEGFAEYDFENNKKQYLQIKKLSFLIICKFLDSDGLNNGISGLKYILLNLKKKIYIDYIDKIRILITYVNGIIFNSKKYQNNLCLLEDHIYGKILSNAHNFLISIYDKLKEESSLYKIFSQYNTYIRYNYTIGHHSFTGSLLTLNDIKLDLYKIALPYYFIYNSNSDNSWAYFDPNSQNVFINLSLFDEFKGDIYSLKNENFEQVSFLMSLVLIHERGGHSKVDEINENNSPRYYYLDNFKISIIKHKESDYLVEEVIYSGNLVSLLSNYENFPLSLKNVDLFVQSNFNKLNELLIENNIKSDDIDDKEKKDSKKPKKKILRKKKKIGMRGYLFSKFNFIIQGKKYDKNLYNDPEYQLFLNLEKNTKRKKY